MNTFEAELVGRMRERLDELRARLSSLEASGMSHLGVPVADVRRDLRDVELMFLDSGVLSEPRTEAGLRKWLGGSVPLLEIQAAKIVDLERLAAASSRNSQVP